MQLYIMTSRILNRCNIIIWSRDTHLTILIIFRVSRDHIITQYIRGGRVREGGVPPPHLEENGNQEMLRGLLKHTKIRIL